MSLATLDRRVVPAIETVKTEWGARLIPVDELERYLTERRQEARAARRRPQPPGRESCHDPELLARIRRDYAKGFAVAEIARRLKGRWRAGKAVASRGRQRYGPSSSARVRPTRVECQTTSPSP